MVPTFPVGDQVESARTMAFFSADLEEPSTAVVHAMVNCTTAVIGQTKPASSCIDKNGHLQ